MANEFNLTGSITFQPAGNPTANVAIGPIVLSIATLGSYRNRVVATTGGVTLDLGGVTNPGYVVILNHDSTNTVDVIANGNTVPLATLRPAAAGTGGAPAKPLGVAMFELSPTVLSPLTYAGPTVTARAGTAVVEYIVYPSA